MSRILVTGASGFIAREIIAQLLQEDHLVTACARNTDFVKTIFPDITCLPCDFLKDNYEATWLKRLNNIDIVINCVGVFQTRREKDTWLVHHETPKALFNACVTAGIKKIVHISALGIDKNELAYSRSKRAIEEHIKNLKLDTTIISPSLVYGPGSYGGSSLFRGFSGLPFILPLPGQAGQRFQPIHIEDLARIVIETLPLTGKQHLCAVGKDTIDLKTILKSIRRWLGFKCAISLPIPMPLIRLTAKIGDLFNAPINTTGIIMMQQDNVASQEAQQLLHKTVSCKPRGFTKGLFSHPSQVQDRWHARLYFVKPLLRYSIAFIWLFTAFISAYLPSSKTLTWLSLAGFPENWQMTTLYAGIIIDALLGFAVLCNIRLRLIGSLQIMIILIYTGLISWLVPQLWLDPFAATAKNISLIMATLTMIALESDR